MCVWVDRKHQAKPCSYYISHTDFHYEAKTVDESTGIQGALKPSMYTGLSAARKVKCESYQGRSKVTATQSARI